MSLEENHRTGPGVPPGKLSALLQQLAAAPPQGSFVPVFRPGQVIGRFEVVREVGRGGLGVVYEARDRELGRVVALKALRGIGSPEMMEQAFLREAETAARLRHPNIVTLLDVGRAEHGPYLVLELLHGKTLAASLTAGAVGAREALRIALEAAKGLAHAHGHGVIHRDLSPNNVFLCDEGQVKVLDFGMAHAFGHRKLEGGTTGYMAPEQSRGAPEDERTDVFSLGVILYRMLTGELPFASREDLEASRLAPALEVSGVPSVGALVRALLQKDPVRRPRDAGDVVTRLQACLDESSRTPATNPRVVVRPPSTRSGHRDHAHVAREQPPNAVAVLPFVNMSADPEQDYFSDGLSEEILNALAHVRGLRVAGRTSSFSFKGSNDVGTIGQKLGVGVILEGSVRRAGGRVRVTAHLVRVADGYHLWSQRYDRDVTDVFAVQDDIAQAVVKALKLKLLRGGGAAARQRFTRDVEVYNEYLLGRHFFNRGNAEGFRLAVRAYERALALAPTYAPAQAALAPALQWLTDVASESLAERLEGQRHAIEAAEKAVALAPDSADGYAARGDVRTHVVWNWAGAQADFEQALAIKPGDASIQLGHAHLIAVVGRLTDAIAIARHAAKLDPLATDAFAYLGSYYSATGRLELARTMLLKALEITPEHDIAREELGLNYLLDGNPTAALSVFEKSKNPMRRLHGIALAQHDLGHPREAQQAIDDMRRRFAYMSAYQIAEACAWSGAPDSAFEWLERSYVERDPGLRRIAYDPRLRSLRGDPRRAALLRKMNLPDCVT